MSVTMETRAPDPGREAHTPFDAAMAERQRRLPDAATQLKLELHGIDAVIDQVIDAVRAWYVLPQVITRPVIVCLWGLTGTGKTQLTRRLAQLLGFYDRFVEVQMDGFSNGSGSRGTTVSGMLGNSGITEGEPGILVLDEFQRFRTVDDKGKDLTALRYQDVWALLSDGRLPPAVGSLQEIERKLADMRHTEERAAREHDDDEPDSDKRRRAAPLRYRLDPWDAQDIRQMLKLREPLLEIMEWPAARVHALLQEFQRSQQSWETDYSRLLIFVSGYLDEMYAHVGYNSFSRLQAVTRQNSLDRICTILAGRAAESLVFGEMACTTGAEHDYRQATEAASRYLRYHGFGERISRTDVTSNPDDHVNTDVEPSNVAMEELLREQYTRATDLLRRHRAVFKAVANQLMQDGQVLPDAMVRLLAAHGIESVASAAAQDGEGSAVLESFAERLERFKE
ncbi:MULTISPECIES: AAA family ATPase [unclassified Cupriavidus]|uniref:AAA family ATPase n=1 Tax=unclassified Cupriavidus TaxID=2640874 RepID=UPI00313BB983